MEFYIFYEGSNFCSAHFDNEIDLIVFLHECEIERLEVVIFFRLCIYRFYVMLDKGFKFTSIYDLLKFVKDLKDK